MEAGYKENTSFMGTMDGEDHLKKCLHSKVEPF